jgi:energy-coupling factor transport system ATP-binding protein
VGWNPVMLEIRHLSFQHHAAEHPAIRDVSLAIEPGMFLGVVGASGAGKSTLLRAMNGLVPHFHGGRLAGTIHVAGMDTRRIGTTDLSRVVGFVSQEPETQTVFDTVVDEVAFGPENIGLPHRQIVESVDEALRLLHIDHLADRDIATLSGGERQRVVIAATLAMGCRLLVLDEPLSQLDPWAASDLLDALDDLRRSGEVGIVVAEHRIDQVLAHCTHVLELDKGQSTRGISTRSEAIALLDKLSTMSRLSRLCDWPEVPETVDHARNLRHRFGPSIAAHTDYDSPASNVRIDAQGISVRAGGKTLVAPVDLQLSDGAIEAVIGPNGAGKTTLLRVLAGLQNPDTGYVTLNGKSVSSLSGAERVRSIGYVPQYPAALFLGETVREEIEISLQTAGSDRSIAEVLKAFALEHLADRFSWDISGGERQRLALAIVIASSPKVLLLDEPTRGMDAHARESLYTLLERLRNGGTAILIATHDMDLVANCAERVTLLDRGMVIAAGSPEMVIGNHPVLAPITARVFGPEVLTSKHLASYMETDHRRSALEAESGLNVHTSPSVAPQG